MSTWPLLIQGFRVATPWRVFPWRVIVDLGSYFFSGYTFIYTLCLDVWIFPSRGYVLCAFDWGPWFIWLAIMFPILLPNVYVAIRVYDWCQIFFHGSNLHIFSVLWCLQLERSLCDIIQPDSQVSPLPDPGCGLPRLLFLVGSPYVFNKPLGHFRTFEFPRAMSSILPPVVLIIYDMHPMYLY